MKKVLFFSSHYWTSPLRLGSHQWATQFQRHGWSVLYISDPLSPFHYFADKTKKNDIQARWKIHQCPIHENGLTAYVPLSLFIPADQTGFRNTQIAKHWSSFTCPPLKHFIRSMQFDNVDLLFIDSLKFSWAVDCFSYGKSILRIADNLSAFNEIPASLLHASEELACKTDRIICSSTELSKSLETKHPGKVHYISNGVNTDHFINAPSTLPSDLESIPQPRVLYVGAMDHWLDLKLMAYACQQLPEISFVFIGPCTMDLSILNTYPNFKYLGVRSYNQIPQYMKNCQAGIIPFDVNHPVTRTVNPLKMYEYFLCDLPVIAPTWKELEMIGAPVYLCKTKQEFVDNVKKAINNSPASKSEGKDFARRNGWEHKYTELMNILGMNS